MPGDLLNTGHRIFLSLTAITTNISCMRNMSRVYIYCLTLSMLLITTYFYPVIVNPDFFTKSIGVITNTVDH